LAAQRDEGLRVGGVAYANGETALPQHQRGDGEGVVAGSGLALGVGDGNRDRVLAGGVGEAAQNAVVRGQAETGRQAGGGENIRTRSAGGIDDRGVGDVRDGTGEVAGHRKRKGGGGGGRRCSRVPGIIAKGRSAAHKTYYVDVARLKVGVHAANYEGHTPRKGYTSGIGRGRPMLRRGRLWENGLINRRGIALFFNDCL